jgi:hypothetical protein
MERIISDRELNSILRPKRIIPNSPEEQADIERLKEMVRQSEESYNRINNYLWWFMFGNKLN